MGRWGDDWDPEVLNKKEPEGRITMNFKKIYLDVDTIMDATVHVDEKHPKTELIKEWTGAMIAFFVIFLLAHNVFMFVAVPILAFYVMALLKIRKAWKQFGYRLLLPSICTIALLVGMAAIAFYVQSFYPF